MAVIWKKLAYEDDVILKSIYDANTILAADSDNTPAALTIAEQRIVGRITGGNIVGLTAAQVLTLLGTITPSIKTVDNVHITDAAAGDLLHVFSDGAVTTSNLNYEKKKEIKLHRGGTWRIKFAIKSSGGAGYPAYGRIYRNGSAVGTERSRSATTYLEYSEDISGWTAGDLCQIYLKTTDVSVASLQNFRLYEAEHFAHSRVIT